MSTEDKKFLLEEKYQKALAGMSPEEVAKIESLCKAPKGGKLKAYQLTDLLRSPFYYGQGGFRCSDCGIQGENMVNKLCFLSKEENYVLCVLC